MLGSPSPEFHPLASPLQDETLRSVVSGATSSLSEEVKMRPVRTISREDACHCRFAIADCRLSFISIQSEIGNLKSQMQVVPSTTARQASRKG
jgi:hypothetical protein